MIGGEYRTLGNTDPALRRAWHPVARAREVTDQPRGVTLLGQPWVLRRGAGRQVVAFVDRCPHRLAPLSAGEAVDGGLRCPYHGWCFDDSGRAVDIPALGPGAPLPPRARLTPAAAVAERHGLVWLAPDGPIADLPDFSSDLAGLEAVDLPVIDTRAGAGLLADNFLDMAHFPFVHRATIGADESRVVAPYEVRRDGWGMEAVYQHPFAHREDPGVAAGVRPLVQTRRMTYRYQAPLALLLRLEYLESDGINVIGFFISPVDAEHCRIFSSLWRDDLDADPGLRAAAVDFEMRVVAEDLALQEQFGELTLPLDVTAEVHTRADRITLELRRILSDLVVTAGLAPVQV